MKRNFVQHFLLHWEDELKLLYNFFGRIDVTPFLGEIFGFIGYANNTTTDVILYYEYLSDCLFCSIK